MQYEHIGNTGDFIKGKTYFVNPKRDGEKVICNIMLTDNQLNSRITKEINEIVYNDIAAFRRDWKPVLADFAQERTEPAELKA